MGVFIDEKPGTIYKHWKVLGFHKIDSHGDARFWCRCSLCDEVYSVKGYTLRNEQSTKCRCCADKGRRQ